MSIKVRGNTLYSGSWDKTIKVWDLSSGDCLQTLRGHLQGVYSIKVVDDVIISCSGDNTIRVRRCGLNESSPHISDLGREHWNVPQGA